MLGESLYVSCVYSYRKALSFFLVKKKITMASSIFSSLNTLFAIVSNVEQHLSLERFSPFDTISALHIIFCEYSDSSRVFCSRRIYTMGPIKIPQKLCIALLIHPSKSSKGTLLLLRKHEWLGRQFRKWQFLPTLCYVNLFLIHPSKS